MHHRPTRALLFLLHILTFFLTFAQARESLNEEFDSASPEPTFPQSVTLQQWPLTADKPSLLGQIAYNSKTKQAKYFSLAKEKGAKGLVRVGITLENGAWIGTVVDGESINPQTHTPVVTIRLDSQGKVFHVEYSTISDKSPPRVLVLPGTNTGPTPHLNKPIVVGPDGKIPQPPVEKTFLQKYWWVILAGMILLLSGGGGGGE